MQLEGMLNGQSEEVWDVEMDYLFYEAHLMVGNKWSAIKEFIPQK